ncbi:MAG: PLP-dependent aspartate aminotransferase family protein, partial [Pseudomonadota bacterium]
MKEPTRLLHPKGGGRLYPTVNPPIERGSSLLLGSRQALYGADTTYGRMGLSVQRELEASLCDLEGAEFAQLTSNGLQACALAIASLVRAGDHVLLADSLYGPTRRFGTRRLREMGVAHTRFPNDIGSNIAELVRPETRLIVLESPGSLTFELSDTPAIVDVAQSRNILTVFDNTWGAGVNHKPLALGVDVVIQALTKYPIGHSDAMGGAVLTQSKHLAVRIKHCAQDWGLSLQPDDAYLALRGLKTLHVRLKEHERSAYEIAAWLDGRDEVDQILHPGRSDHPQHEIWKRDFSGACGLFSIVLKPATDAQLDAFFEALRVFGLGFSWGGFESL